MGQMHVVHDGPRQAPPLLLIHGSGGSGGYWSLVVPALAGHHHIIRVDLPGSGQSPPAPSYDVTVQAGRVAAVLDDLGLRRVTVAGHSSGGYIATALADQRPDLVGSLALISTGPSLDAFLPQPLLLRALLAPPLGPLGITPKRAAQLVRFDHAAHLLAAGRAAAGVAAESGYVDQSHLHREVKAFTGLTPSRGCGAVAGD